MDTVSKKFNIKAIRKAVAFILCLVCVALMTSSGVNSFLLAKDNNLTMNSLRDALSGASSKSVWESDSFKSAYNGYINALSSMVGSYGNGSKEAFESADAKIQEYNEAVWAQAKTNLVKHLQKQSICYDFLVAEYDGVVSSLGCIAPTDLSEEESYYYVEDVLKDRDFDYNLLIEHDYDFDDTPQITIYKEMLESAKELGADGIVKLDYNCMITLDYEYENTAVIKEYPSGYYAFKINETALKTKLCEYDVMKNFLDYETFRKSYSTLKQTVEQYYDTGRYFVMDSKGNTYTNMKGLSAKSTTQEIAEAFEKLGFFCYQSAGEMYLPDGRAYSFMSIDGYTYYSGYYEVTTFPNVDVYSATTDSYPTLTTLPPETSEEATTFIVESTTSLSAVTAPVVTPLSFTTTLPADYPVYDSTPFIADGEILCFVGVDIYADDDSVSSYNRFKAVSGEIRMAETIVKNFLLIWGVCLAVFVIALIRLIAMSGKRSGDKKSVYLHKTDKIFAEIRIAVSALLSLFGAWLALVIFDFVDSSTHMGGSIYVYGLAAVAVFEAAVLIDILLYFTRLLKSKRFFKSFFVVRFFGKAVALVRGFVRKIKDFVKKLKAKLLYVKDLKKTVFIRTAIVAAVNAVVLMFTIALIYSSGLLPGLFSLFVLGLFDLFIIYKGLIFVGGVDRLFRVVSEMRKGNLEEKINKNALPDYLMLPAENLQGLGDGLKVAVEEAVRQEQTKTELITNVSHDLKTPLTSIINYVDLLKKCDITDETAVSYLNVLSEKSDRLKTLIDDLVEASKASTGAISVSFIDVSLKELLNQILGEYEDAFEKKKLSLIVDLPENDIIVRADSKLLYRVMENLLVNVRKYALENSRVYISIRTTDKEGLIEIKNISAAPLNISAEELKSRFVRGDQSRSTEGNGLGLSIAENLCVIQEGRLELEINGDLFVARVEMKLSDRR